MLCQAGNKTAATENSIGEYMLLKPTITLVVSYMAMNSETVEARVIGMTIVVLYL
jgi:hypothetical protein